MEEKYLKFSDKHITIFGELVRRYWNGSLNNTSDLDGIAEEIREKYHFKPEELPFIRDHIRLAMGLDPKGSDDFGDELDMVKGSKEISRPVVTRIDGPCEVCDNKKCTCVSQDKYEAPIYYRNGRQDGKEDCIGCGFCVDECDFGAIMDKNEFLPMIDLLKDKNTPVYAVAAPAIVGQFGSRISMGKLRSALKTLGFEDMIEVALFADILTIREAFEFNQLVRKKEDFFLTSCCCPVWFNMIKKNYPEVYSHLSPSVSPMIAAGRILKKLYEDAKIVFIAPCIAKKTEAVEPDLKDAVDYVINFRELQEVFHTLEISLEELQDDEKDQASLGGRIYARTGGVSFSVKTVVNRLEPGRVIKLKPKKVHGVKACRTVLEKLIDNGEDEPNFIEGMGCSGGCVGGPRTNIDPAQAAGAVNEYGEDSLILTPFDNLNVMKILKQFGIQSIDEIVQNEELKKILSRN
jgi:Iron only hydrogenase large subunit, C-terminal domain